jgi:hypothetical protein
LWVHTIRLVGWEIEKESDTVKQKHGGVAQICIDQQKRPERVELWHTPPGFGGPKRASMAVMGDGKNGRPGSKCNCCFETHGSRSGMVQSVVGLVPPQTEAAKGSAEKVSGSVDERW